MSENNKFVIATTKWRNIFWGYSIGDALCRLTYKKENVPKIYDDWDSLVIGSHDELTKEKIDKDASMLSCQNFTVEPRYIFFPHWSWKIPKEIYEHYECVAFHMTDLPYGRGGSPLQNLIVREKYYTQISAFRVTEGMDEGPIYLKHPLLP